MPERKGRCYRLISNNFKIFLSIQLFPSPVTTQATDCSVLGYFSSSRLWTLALSSCAPKLDARSLRPLLLYFSANPLQSASSHSGCIPDKGALQRYRKVGWSSDQAIGLEIRKHMLHDGSWHMSWAQDIGQVYLSPTIHPSLLKLSFWPWDQNLRGCFQTELWLQGSACTEEFSHMHLVWVLLCK